MRKLAYTLVFFVAAAALFGLLMWAKFMFSHQAAPSSVGFEIPLNQPPDVLFIGSSHTRDGYDIRAFEQATGRDAFMLAYNGLSYWLMLPVIEHLLEQPNKPGLLVIENFLDSAHGEPRLFDKRLYAQAPPAVKRALLQQLRAEGMSFEQGYDLAVSGKNQDIVASPLVNPVLDRSFYRGGHVLSTRRQMNAARFRRIKVREPYGRVNPQHLAALEAILGLLEHHGVSTVFIETPMAGPIERDKAFIRAKRQLVDVIEDAGFCYIDGAAGFDVDAPSNFRDAGHLSGKGRALFTAQVAEMLFPGQVTRCPRPPGPSRRNPG
ncbi:hypothetical protein F3N42_00605 [Marinihelvus fidelis]|uniref:SGNH/GDSL hydrolase family protein n=1 Tax=Marinihelvus fidelis TaxID=2613842 RepID=A0A5N0THZ5_9GAMM|nr:hypothetical protein [Marinihelvus fidelis]KAA9134084.1 hypothetical protein F3N42_00605 [Marinihelvus fidelis]